MKQHFTLIQKFNPESGRRLSDYLSDQGIDYHLGADFDDELGYIEEPYNQPRLMAKCVVLIDEHELSAIMLSVEGVTVIKNRPFVNAKNKIRGWFKWIVS